MFTIDLLKGRGKPLQRKPQYLAIGAVTFLVPVVIAIIMLGSYLSTSVAMSIQKEELNNYQSKIDNLTDAVAAYRAFEKEKKSIEGCLGEVSKSIGQYAQWSPVLVEIVENIPGSVILTELEVRKRAIRKKIPKKGKPGEMIDTIVPVRTLRIDVCGSPDADCDQAVKDFRQALRYSALLGPRLEYVIVSQKHDKLNGSEVVSYSIECVFKEGF